MLFRMVFFVEGKHLEKALVAVQGLALNMEVPQPVVNAAIDKGKVVAVKRGGYSLLNEVTAAVLKYKKDDVITSAILKAAVVAAGGQETSFGYISKSLRDAGLLKVKSKGVYIITGKGK